LKKLNQFPYVNVAIGNFRNHIETFKAVLLQAWSGPEGSRKLKFPDFMTTALGGGYPPE